MVRPTGKAFDDSDIQCLTGDHGASQYVTLEVRNVYGEMVSKRGAIHPRH